MKKYGFLIIITVMLLAAICAAWYLEADQGDWIYVELAPGGEKIDIWEDAGNRFYVFLPGYAQLSDVELILETEIPVYLDGALLESGMNCSNLSLNTEYVLEYAPHGTQKKKILMFQQSGSVATMYVDTKSGTMAQIHKNKKVQETGSLRLYTHNAEVDFCGDLQSISGRGNTSWTDTEKKSYSLSLSQEADLLGMGSAQNWVLLANAFDPSNLRNKIVFDFAADFGMPYSPDSQWVDLYLNGDYAGLYLLCERNEVHPQRVNISEKDSFLVSVEMSGRLVSNEDAFITTDEKQALQIHHLEPLSVGNSRGLAEIWRGIESAIMAEDGIDPKTGRSWLDMIDLDSWVRKYLIEETFGNVDGGILSQFYYKDGNDPEGKVYAGPVWDYDRTMGLDSVWVLESPETLYVNQLHEGAWADSPWFYQLYQKEAFRNRVQELYQDEFMPKLREKLEGGLREYTDLIGSAVQMDRVRWGKAQYDLNREAGEICNYLNRRMDFLKSVFCDGIQYCYVHAFSEYVCSYAVLPGERLTNLYAFFNTADQNFLGWFVQGTDEPFDPSQPITEDIYIYAKWEDNREYGRFGLPLNGIVEKNGKLYYYENGRGVEKGLLQYKGAYYFAMYLGELVVDQEYYAWMTSCDLPMDRYEFGADGKMLDGIVEKNGKLYYYENGRGMEKGLFQYEGAYYFAMYQGELVLDQEYYAWMTSCDLPVGNYRFGPDGKMLP